MMSRILLDQKLTFEENDEHLSLGLLVSLCVSSTKFPLDDLLSFIAFACITREMQRKRGKSIT
jgi:hypothetical protein